MSCPSYTLSKNIGWHKNRLGSWHVKIFCRISPIVGCNILTAKQPYPSNNMQVMQHAGKLVKPNTMQQNSFHPCWQSLNGLRSGKVGGVDSALYWRSRNMLHTAPIITVTSEVFTITIISIILPRFLGEGKGPGKEIQHITSHQKAERMYDSSWGSAD